MRIAAAVVEPLFRSRKDCRAVALRLNLGNLGGFPCRSLLRPAEKPSSALPRSTAASSNTCWHTSARQASPGPASSSPPAASERFHALKALMRSKPDQGTWAGSVPLPACRFASSAFSTKRKHWLNAKREAPTCRRSACSCSRLGTSVKLKVVCRLMLPNQIGSARKRRAQRAERNEPSVRPLGLVIARGNSPKLLQTAEPALDDVAQPINLLVKTPRHDAIRSSRDHDFEIELP